MTLRSILLALTSMALFAPALAAQGWSVSVAAGRAVDDPVAARLPSSVTSLGVDYADSADRWLYATAGTPLWGDGPEWGAAGAGGWLGVDRGGVSLGARIGAHLFGWAAEDSTPSGTGGTVEVMPTLSAGRGPIRAELASGFVGTMETSGGFATRRGLSQSLARVTATPAEGIGLTAEARYLHGSGGDWPYAGASLQLLRGAWGGWAYGGEWLRANLPAPRTAYGAGASYTRWRTRLEAGVRQEPVDPLYLGTPRRSWTVRLSRALGRAPRPTVSTAAAPPPVAVVEGGAAVFRLPRAAYASAPAVLGDFDGWTPVTLRDAGEVWMARVPVPPGVHHYAFRAADGTVFVPPGVPAVDDGFGGRSAVLVVP